MNVRPRLLTSTFVAVRMEMMSNKTKPPTHYETLEVHPRATQGEIKSAYFKLSKQYHPDKNSSEAATAKFRDIADAYSVVGNYETRKTYDRSILTRTRHQAPHSSDKPEDPNMKYYQSQAALYRQSAKSGSTPLYDFDAWTKAHYGRTLNRTLQDKQNSRSRRENRKNNMTNAKIGIEVFVAYVIVGLILVFIIGLSPNDVKNLDQPLQLGQRNELESSSKDESASDKLKVDLLSSK